MINQNLSLSVIKTSAIVSQSSKYEILSFELFYQVHQSIRETYKIKYSIHVQIQRKFLCRGKSPIIFEVESSYHKNKVSKFPFLSSPMPSIIKYCLMLVSLQYTCDLYLFHLFTECSPPSFSLLVLWCME